MARPASKTPIALQIMHDNADKPMDQVLPLIQDALELKTIYQARTYYKKLVEEHNAPGIVESKRPRKSATEKAAKPKVIKEPKAIAIANTTIARPIADNAKPKTDAEIEAIRAANLAKIREVHQKMIAKGQLPNTLKQDIDVIDEPEFNTSVEQEIEQESEYPAFLTKDQLDYIL